MSCPPWGHFHCTQCAQIFHNDDFAKMYTHIQAEHPEVWAANPELRAEASEWVM